MRSADTSRDGAPVRAWARRVSNRWVPHVQVLEYDFAAGSDSGSRNRLPTAVREPRGSTTRRTDTMTRIRNHKTAYGPQTSHGEVITR